MGCTQSNEAVAATEPATHPKKGSMEEVVHTEPQTKTIGTFTSIPLSQVGTFSQVHSMLLLSEEQAPLSMAQTMSVNSMEESIVAASRTSTPTPAENENIAVVAALKNDVKSKDTMTNSTASATAKGKEAATTVNTFHLDEEALDLDDGSAVLEVEDFLEDDDNLSVALSVASVASEHQSILREMTFEANLSLVDLVRTESFGMLVQQQQLEL